MSLVNDMLRDLESRRRAQDADALAGLHAAETGSGARRWGGWVALVLAIAALGGAAWWALGTQAERMLDAQRTTAAGAAAEPAAQDGAEAAPDRVTITAMELAPREGGAVLTLRAEGRLDHRLERSSEDNRVRLVIDRATSEAQLPDLLEAGPFVTGADARAAAGDWLLELWLAEGTRVQTRGGGDAGTLTLELRSPAEPEPAAAESPGKSATSESETASGKAPDAATTQETPSAGDTGPQPSPGGGGEPAKQSEPRPDTDSGQPTAAKAPETPTQTETKQAEAAREEGSGADSSFQKRPAADREAVLQRRYSSAAGALDDGDTAGAARQLKALLSEAPGFHPARELLAEVYAATGRQRQAVSLLQEGLHRAPGHGPFVLQASRLLAGGGAVDQAVSLLERYREAVGPNPEYAALLGALLQRQGDYQRSIEAYREALAGESGRGSWWIGLAISQESAGEKTAALRSYRTGLRKGGMAQSLSRYAETRIAALSGTK